jgi:uncharacterized protein YrrD
LDIFNQDLEDGQLLPLKQLLNIDAGRYLDNVIDIALNYQNKSITAMLTLKSGYIDMHEVIKIEDKVLRPLNEYRLVQSCSICLY